MLPPCCWAPAGRSQLRQESMAGAFLAAALATVVVVSIVQRVPLGREVEQLVVASPLLFFASIMLTER